MTDPLVPPLIPEHFRGPKGDKGERGDRGIDGKDAVAPDLTPLTWVVGINCAVTLVLTTIVIMELLK